MQSHSFISAILRRPWALARYGSLVGILILGGYLLVPPTARDRAAAGGAGTTAPARSKDAKYVIKLSPGQAYLPGSRPGGVGEPLVGLRTVIDRFEALHPDTRIEVLNAPSVREYLVTQLSSGAAPDIVNVNVEDVWVDVQKNWYVPLDGFLERPNPFVAPGRPGSKQWWDMFRYQAISRGKAAPNGKNYCLSLDMVETGIFYNKTLFAELGLTPPQTWEQFLDLMATIQAAGKIAGGPREDVIPLLMHLDAFNDWGKDLIFDQLYFNLLPGIDLKKEPQREGYLQGYLDPEELAFLFEKGFFTRQDPRYVRLWEIMRELKRYTNDNMTSIDLTREFVTQRGAMLWTASPLTYRLISDHRLKFDWGVFYLPQFTSKTSRYASNTPMCVIGGAASQFEVTCSAVGDTDASLPFAERMEKSERLKRVIAFLQFLCVAENTQTVVNEYACFLPNIVGVEPLPQLKPFADILERRYTTTKWIFSFGPRFGFIQERMLSLYLVDGIDTDGLFDWQEDNIARAVDDLRRRKKPDMKALGDEWKRLAPVRANYKGLPPGAREGSP